MEIKEKHTQKPEQKYILRKNGSLKISSINSEPSKTQQQFKAECDINNIVKSYSQTGILPVSTKVGAFLDVSNISDYQTSLNTVYQAQKAFDDLPSKIRTRFKNDPNELIAFIEDDKNHEEALTLGLLKSTATSKIPKPTPPQNS